MRVHVDIGACETHALCVFAAPEVFALDADDELVVQATPEDRHRDSVEEAVRSCPVRAISILGG